MRRMPHIPTACQRVLTKLLDRLRDDDLAYLMAINTKDLHKICGKLREDRFLAVSVVPRLPAPFSPTC